MKYLGSFLNLQVSRITQIFLPSTNDIELMKPNGEYIGGKKKLVIRAIDLNYSICC